LSEDTGFSEDSRDTPARGFLFPQPVLWATRSLGNPFFGGFRGGSSSMMHPPPGALPTRSCGFFCQVTSTGGGAHHLALLGRAVPPILLLLEGKGKGGGA